MSTGWKVWLALWALLVVPGVIFGILLAGGFPEPPADALDFALWLAVLLAFLSLAWLGISKIIPRPRS